MLLASLSTLLRAGVLLAVLGSVLLGAGDVLAIVIDPSGFSLARHDRFYQPSGQNDPPKDFIGAGIGMSGIARFQSRPNSAHWATMISDRYFITAGHTARSGEVGKTITFHQDDDLSSTTWSPTVESGFEVGNADLWVGRLDEPAPAWVQRFPLLKRPYDYGLDVHELSTVDPSVHVIGRSSSPNPLTGGLQQIRVGRNKLDGFGYSLQAPPLPFVTRSIDFSSEVTEFPGDEATVRGGDSGGPTLSQLPTLGHVLSGIHIARSFDAVTSFDADVSHYAEQIAADIASDSILNNDPVTEVVTIVTDLLGDLDLDFDVDNDDQLILNANLGATGVGYSGGDLNRDGTVDQTDADALAANLGLEHQSPVDFDNNKTVEGADFQHIANNWQTTVGVSQPGDASGDGAVDFDDVQLYEDFWIDIGHARPDPLLQITGDADDNGGVDDDDLVLVASAMGTSVPSFTGGDVDGDGQVTAADLEIVRTNLGRLFGDTNNDELVDAADVAVIDTNWNQLVTGGAVDGDLNEDGLVDATDLAAIGDWWGYAVEVTATEPGDFNGDGVVDAGDYAMWRNNLGEQDLVPFTMGDGDGDGQVTLADLDVWKSRFGLSLAAISSSGGLPEPSTGSALLTTLLAWSWRARYRGKRLTM